MLPLPITACANQQPEEHVQTVALQSEKQMGIGLIIGAGLHHFAYMTRRPLLLITAVILLLAGLWSMRELQQAPSPQFSPSLHGATDGLRTPADSVVPPRDALPAFLTKEAHDTIALIQRNGPFPHRQDGTVFGNREKLLPQRPRGYYREFTVRTPGLDHRGARRIVTGGDPPDIWYYTDDHYESFRSFSVPAQEGSHE